MVVDGVRANGAAAEGSCLCGGWVADSSCCSWRNGDHLCFIFLFEDRFGCNSAPHDGTVVLEAEEKKVTDEQNCHESHQTREHPLDFDMLMHFWSSSGAIVLRSHLNQASLQTVQNPRFHVWRRWQFGIHGSSTCLTVYSGRQLFPTLFNVILQRRPLGQSQGLGRHILGLESRGKSDDGKKHTKESNEPTKMHCLLLWNGERGAYGLP